MVTKVEVDDWPLESGRYAVGDKKACVAVCTLSTLDIELPMDDIAIAGKCVTENIGMEKIIKNIIANPNIRYLLICGVEPKGHYVGQAFKCLVNNGLDTSRRIIGARGAMPFIKNLTDEQLKQFKKQIDIIDMIEEEDAGKIMNKIKDLNDSGAFEGTIVVGSAESAAKVEATLVSNSVKPQEPETIIADYDPDKDATADNALDDNFFTILVDRGSNQILVEHYIGQAKKLDCKIVGKTAEAIIGTIVKKNLVKNLYHAAYLGKELKKAEIALKTGRDYEQDKDLVF